MNAVERLLYYGDKNTLPQEAAYENRATEPSAGWPGKGAIQFRDAVMSYRPGLPAVLKGMWVTVLRGMLI